MRLRIPEKDIPEDGFSENDLLDRKPLADTILSLVTNVEHELIIGLDAKWGEGKTYFLQQLRAYSSSTPVKIVWFDAFQHDLSGDAFSAVTGHLLSVLDDAKQSTTLRKARTQLTKAAVNVGKVLAKGSAKAATSYLSGGLLSASQIQTFFEGEVESKAIAEGLAELVDQGAAAALSNVLEEYSKSSENVEALHKALAKVAEVLTGGKPNGKILFVIDELDRCRPNFSIDVIEVVKHFYSTEHVSFVLAADFQQIETSIRHCYGREIDARRYLEKFYDLKLNFPQKAQTKNSAALQYTKYAIAQMVDEPSEEHYLEDLMEQLFELTDRIDISIRTLQKIIACVNIAQSQMKESAFRAPPIVIALCVTKVLFPEIYRELATGHGTPEQLMNCFGLTDSDAYSVSTLSHSIGCWKYCLLPEEQLRPFISTDPQLDDAAARSIQLWVDLGHRRVQRRRIFPTVARRFIDNFEVAS